MHLSALSGMRIPSASLHLKSSNLARFIQGLFNSICKYNPPKTQQFTSTLYSTYNRRCRVLSSAWPNQLSYMYVRSPLVMALMLYILLFSLCCFYSITSALLLACQKFQICIYAEIFKPSHARAIVYVTYFIQVLTSRYTMKMILDKKKI